MNKFIATDNEVITTSEVTVIAGEGQVTIAGAQGKKVVITNILGQTVANTVITSDNAVIAAPQGVIVVAVEGEEAAGRARHEAAGNVIAHGIFRESGNW